MKKLSLMIITMMFAGLLMWMAPSVAWASAGDDSSWELGTWAISDFTPRDPTGNMNLNTATVMAGGFRLAMAGSVFTTVDVRENQNCKERHLRDPRFSVGGNAGNDSYSFDKNDLGLFVDHGDVNSLWFANQIDAWDLQGQYVRWGNWDLEWIYIFACNFLSNNGNPFYLENDKKMMAGSHAICGFVDVCTYYDPGASQGRTWADLMRGAFPYTYARTIINAWNEGNDCWQPNGTRLRLYYGTYCWEDYLPGVGTYYTSDPVPYESGGISNSYLYTCG